jgi:hypothetical protein
MNFSALQGTGSSTQLKHIFSVFLFQYSFFSIPLSNRLEAKYIVINTYIFRVGSNISIYEISIYSKNNI